ncbi:hypothetical protein HJC99_05740 [Candidatus Saccharibacteria bacterium]|nr:hypothetical protein [Candidatus Saccharibacteria bacterium]
MTRQLQLSRPIIALQLILATLFGMAAVAYYCHHDADSRADTVSSGPALNDSYGISASFNGLSSDELTSQTAAIRATGASWVRYDLR